MYYYGKGVEQDLVKAKKYYEKALSNSDFNFDDWSSFNEETKKTIQGKIDDIHTALEKTEAEKKEAAARRAERTEVFVSYSHVDASYRGELQLFFCEFQIIQLTMYRLCYIIIYKRRGLYGTG